MDAQHAHESECQPVCSGAAGGAESERKSEFVEENLTVSRLSSLSVTDSELK